MADYQYGGWYNGRQWDGTRLGAPGEIIVGQNSSPLDLAKQNYDSAAGEVNKFIDDLVNQAQGDYDFAAKWIENQYKVARGSDNQAQADFLKQVANGLEEKVGRIAFDYQTGTYRANQSADIATNRTIQGRDLALQRLNQDEQAYKSDFNRQAQQTRESENASLNQRGILSTPRDQATGLAGKVIGNTEAGLQSQLDAYQRQLDRSRQDTTIGANQTLEDIGLNKTRTLEDLTTGARRSALDTDMQRQQGLEEAQRVLDQRKLQLQQQRESLLKKPTVDYADYVTRGGLGL